MLRTGDASDRPTTDVDPPAGDETSRPILAVVGCGRMGARFHVPALARRNDVELRALVDPRREAVERLATDFGVPSALTNVDDLAEIGVTAAVVAAPNHTHAGLAVDLLEGGIDVLVEKPMAPTAGEVGRMAESARRSGRLLAAAHPLRFSRAARLARELIAHGALGDVTAIDVEYGTASTRPTVTDRRRQRETIGGGVLMDLGSHVLDLLVWWFGDLTLTGYQDDARGGVEADCVCDLELKSGGKARVELSWDRELTQRAILHGERGTLEVGLGRNHVVWSASGARPRVRGQALAGPADVGQRETLADLVEAAHTDFIRALVDGRAAVLPDEAVRSVHLIEQCYAVRQALVPPWAGSVRDEEAPREATSETLGALRGTRVLVTGATGFIGGRLVEELILTHGAEVRALVRDPSTATRLLRFPVEIVWGSVNDREAVSAAVAGCEIVFHCAHDTSSPLSKVRTGIGGTETVAGAAERAGVMRVVHLSSFVVYGPTRDGDLHEGSPWRRTRDAYALSKRFGERTIESAHERGLPSVILQPTIVYGPWGKRWTAGCAHQIKTGLVPVIDSGSGFCNVVYVDDVVSAMLLAATSPRAVGERFLVSARQPVTWREFYGEFEQVIGRDAVVEVPDGSLPALARAQRRRLRRGLARQAVGGVRGALTDPEARTALRTLPSVRLAAAIGEHLVGSHRWERLKTEVVERGADLASDGAHGLLHIPGKNVVDSQRSRTRVRIDRARRELGYEPEYDLGRGMSRTAAFLRWARLA